MSKRRPVITAVLAGQSQSEVARAYGVSQGWISRLMARYRVEGEAAFEPLSRAPKTSPGATHPETVEPALSARPRTDVTLDAAVIVEYMLGEPAVGAISVAPKPMEQDAVS